MDENIKLLNKVNIIDWATIQKAEQTIADTLEEFQISVDAFMETIKNDMGRWKSQNASLIAKHEADRVLIKSLY